MFKIPELQSETVKREIRARLESDLYKKNKTCYEILIQSIRILLKKHTK